MSYVKERHKKVLDKFQELLRSGKDYSVKYMYEEAGKAVYIDGRSVEKIVNTHYNSIITDAMVGFLHSLDCPRVEEIKRFSKEFNVCRRESILIIRYIRRRKNGRR